VSGSSIRGSEADAAPDAPPAPRPQPGGGASRGDDRGQAHTLEGLAAAVIIVAGIAFALQATAVTPLTASTSNQHIENQQRAAATNVLETAQADGDLVETALYWNESRGAFRDSGGGGTFSNGGPPTDFGEALNRTFAAETVAFNVRVGYRTPDGGEGRAQLVEMGDPSDNAVAATRTAVIFDDDRLTGTTTTVAEASDSLYAPDVDPDGPLYNVLEVRVTVWRI